MKDYSPLDTSDHEGETGNAPRDAGLFTPFIGLPDASNASECSRDPVITILTFLTLYIKIIPSYLVH